MAAERNAVPAPDMLRGIRRGMAAARTGLAAAVAMLLCLGAARAAPVAESRHGMVVTAQREASEVGAAILQAGGNAVDAAVAVGYALAVVDPCCGNIGGGGFMLIRRADGSRTVHQFPREGAARRASRTMYLDAAGNVEPRGEPLRLSRRRGAGHGDGARPRAAAIRQAGPRRVMAPAIALARDGFVLGPADAAISAARAERAGRRPRGGANLSAAGRHALSAGRPACAAGSGGDLGADRRTGAGCFYRGPIAAAVAAAAAAQGGVLTTEDFAEYTVTEAAPVGCSYRGYRILSAPPPSAGGTVSVRDAECIGRLGPGAARLSLAATLHLMAETMRHAYIDRNSAFGDPAFVADPGPRLLSPGHAAAIRAAIDPGKASTSSAALGPGIPPHEPAETTHYSIVDGEGNAVAVTYTLNGNFGSAVVAPGTGFCSTTRWTISR